MNKNIRVQFIGNYLEDTDKILKKNGIICESFISTCNPLAMAGRKDETVMEKYGSINHLPTLLNIRKNLSDMLSRDTETFCNNYNYVPAAETIRYKNTTEYVIVMNTNARYTIFVKDGIPYSDIYPQNDFTKELKSNKEYRTIRFPFPEDFNWQYYYDKFIDALLNEYDSRHIILIRVNSAQWYMDGSEIMPFASDSSRCRQMVEKMDEYFLERTGCLCVWEQYNHIPHEKRGCAFPYAISSPYAYKMYSQKIIDILNNGNFERYAAPKLSGGPFVKLLMSKLAGNVINENNDELKFICENTITGIPHLKEKVKETTGFINDIVLLERFLDPDISYTLSDYVLDFCEADRYNHISEIDPSLVNAYVKLFKLDINDIIAVYKFSTVLPHCKEINEIISNILNNSDCIPLRSAFKLKEKNLEYLKNYSYKSFEINNGKNSDKVYIRVENNMFFIINGGNMPVEKVDLSQSLNYMSVIDRGYVCTIGEADALCSSLSFYLERAKGGKGSSPVTIKYETLDEFYDSLYYTDYSEILENEKFVLTVGENECEIQNYSPKCDLSFLFQENVKIVSMGNGFNDQINFFNFAKVLQNEFDSKIYFDDIFTTVSSAGSHFTNIELHRIVNENIQSMFLSNYFSEKLMSYLGEHQRGFATLPQNLNECGFTDITAYSVAGGVFENAKCNRILIKDCTPTYLANNLDRIHSMKCSYYYFYTHIYDFYSDKCKNVGEYLSFPKFDDDVNIEYERLMQECDAVVIHFRRGDYIQFTMGKNCVDDTNYTDFNFYIEAISRLQTINDYPNKKYFIFSDDVSWVQKHTKEVGLDLIGDAPIYYINHNVYNESYKDMQLMMNGKIMIISQSGFATNAAFLSDRCECLAALRGKAMECFTKVGKKYKHDLEPLPRGRFVNWS